MNFRPTIILTALLSFLLFSCGSDDSDDNEAAFTGELKVSVVAQEVAGNALLATQSLKAAPEAGDYEYVVTWTPVTSGEKVTYYDVEIEGGTGDYELEGLTSILQEGALADGTSQTVTVSAYTFGEGDKVTELTSATATFDREVLDAVIK